ncbi:MAG: ATPase [Treponema sp.]|jgi:vacuolar-type H+-ATPase subunit H|nr:ATPase [Treponema sp.]
MEELQSTEALDREILEDARKKAFKILKTAGETEALSKAAWDKKLEKKLAEAGDSYRLKEERERREIMARLPLDERRIRSGKIEGFLAGAMNDFLRSLDRGKILSVLERELSVRLASCETGASCKAEDSCKAEASCKAEDSCVLRYRGLEPDEIDALIKTFLRDFPDPGLVSKKEDPLYAVAGSLPAVALDFPALRINSSVDAAAAALLLDKRAELAAALLGKGFADNDAEIGEGGEAGGQSGQAGETGEAGDD